MLAQELFLGVGVADIGDDFRSDDANRWLRLLLLGDWYRHLWHSSWNWHCSRCCRLLQRRLLLWDDGDGAASSATKRGEATLVYGDALLGWHLLLITAAWVLLLLIMRSLIAMVVLSVLLLVLSL